MSYVCNDNLKYEQNENKLQSAKKKEQFQVSLF